MTDPFNRTANLHGLAADLYPVTPSDGSDNVGTGNVALGLYIETGGDVVVITKYGETRTINVPDYFYLICGVTRVKSTGTTATGIHALVI